MSETPLDKVQEFIKWLYEWKMRRGEDWTDRDSYAVGIYAVYLAQIEKRGAGHAQVSS